MNFKHNGLKGGFSLTRYDLKWLEMANGVVRFSVYIGVFTFSIDSNQPQKETRGLILIRK